MTWGSMVRGNLRMLKSESDTKARSASRMLFSSTVTNTANVVRATWEHIGKTGRLAAELHRFAVDTPHTHARTL